MRHLRDFKLQLRRTVFVKCQEHCCYCGERLSDHFTLDHVKPLAHGGRTTEHNLVLSCQQCNQRKGDHTLETFLRAEPSAAKHFARFAFTAHWDFRQLAVLVATARQAA